MKRAPSNPPRIRAIKAAISRGECNLGGENTRTATCYTCNARTSTYGRNLYVWSRSRLILRKGRKRRERIGGGIRKLIVCPACAIEVRVRIDLGGWLYTDNKGRKCS